MSRRVTGYSKSYLNEIPDGANPLQQEADDDEPSIVAKLFNSLFRPILLTYMGKILAISNSGEKRGGLHKVLSIAGPKAKAGLKLK